MVAGGVVNLVMLKCKGVPHSHSLMSHTGKDTRASDSFPGFRVSSHIAVAFAASTDDPNSPTVSEAERAHGNASGSR